MKLVSESYICCEKNLDFYHLFWSSKIHTWLLSHTRCKGCKWNWSWVFNLSLFNGSYSDLKMIFHPPYWWESDLPKLILVGQTPNSLCKSGFWPHFLKFNFRQKIIITKYWNQARSLSFFWIFQNSPWNWKSDYFKGWYCRPKRGRFCRDTL